MLDSQAPSYRLKGTRYTTSAVTRAPLPMLTFASGLPRVCRKNSVIKAEEKCRANNESSVVWLDEKFAGISEGNYFLCKKNVFTRKLFGKLHKSYNN